MSPKYIYDENSSSLTRVASTGGYFTKSYHMRGTTLHLPVLISQ
jgi:hypothetical protein